MPSRPPTFRPPGSRSPRQYERDRGSARERGYDGNWRKSSKSHLAEHPVCEYCALDGLVVAATLVDHLYPQRRFPDVFWRTEWWVSSCAPCHAGLKQRVENAGRRAIDDLAARLGRAIME
jgi:5-methylcytosine-specific restriction protein A